MRKQFLTLATTMTLAMGAQAIELPTQPYLDMETALKLAHTAVKQCKDDGYNVSVTVVDAAGLTRAQLRSDKAGPHTVESSRKKAFTSASMGRPTADFAKLIAEKPITAGLRDMDPRILILGGGLPIKVNGEKVGGIGVGGAPGGHLDQACAQIAIDKILGK